MDTTNQTPITDSEFPRNWLQLFADEVPGAAGGGAPDLGAATQPAPDAAASAVPATAATPELLDFGGRRVPKSPETEALHQDWRNQQAAMTRANQELLRYKAMGVPATNPASAQPAAQTPAQAPATTTQALLESLSPERRAEFQAALYGDDAAGAIEQFFLKPMADRLQQQMQQTMDSRMQSVMPQVQQIQQQLRVQDELSALAAEFPDLEQHAQAMQQIIDEQPGIVNLNNGLKSVYQMAKAQTAQAAPTAAQIMQDPAVRQQIIAESRNQIIQEYLSSVQSGAAPPVVLGAQPAAATPVLPANKPRTIEEAHRAGLAWLATQG